MWLAETIAISSGGHHRINSPPANGSLTRFPIFILAATYRIPAVIGRKRRLAGINKLTRHGGSARNAAGSYRAFLLSLIFCQQLNVMWLHLAGKYNVAAAFKCNQYFRGSQRHLRQRKPLGMRQWHLALTIYDVAANRLSYRLALLAGSTWRLCIRRDWRGVAEAINTILAIDNLLKLADNITARLKICDKYQYSNRILCYYSVAIRRRGSGWR